MSELFWVLYPTCCELWRFPVSCWGQALILDLWVPWIFFQILCLGSFSGLEWFPHTCTDQDSAERLKEPSVGLQSSPSVHKPPLWWSSLLGFPRFSSPSPQLKETTGFCLVSLLCCNLEIVNYANCIVYLIGFPSLRSHCSSISDGQCPANCFIYFVQFFSCLNQKGKSGPCYSIVTR